MPFKLPALVLTLASLTSPVAATEYGQKHDPDFARFCEFVQQDYAYWPRRPQLDWPAACAQHRARALQAGSRGAWIAHLEAALDELADAHAHLSTNTPVSTRLIPSQSDLRARWRGEVAELVAVRQPSAAWAAGLRPGDRVLSVKGQALRAAARARLPRGEGDDLAWDWALQQVLAGRHEQKEMSLQRQTPAGSQTLIWRPHQPQAASLLSHGREGDVAWVRIHNSLGQNGLIEAFDQALAELGPFGALVLDLRDTPSGGNSHVARGLMGRLVTAPRPYQQHEAVAEGRGGVRRVWTEWVLPRQPLPERPVLVLVGPWTGSMGEGLAIGLNAARGAPVLGQPMAGLLGALGEERLPLSGITVRIPTETLAHVDGRPREAFVPEPLQGDAEQVWQQALTRARLLR
ncbi:carboxyl-terminal processing protease [Inhella inkyongensis]|uniref:Carboxyl-terminal processing protease n=1 Tax=Inhella inkyongensis TaxID=392593 RepID=A0A840S9M5_9BURK|nr:S41 family peptidase [Inhella inkyongensis]MBB5205100.1 carboxyl-terminal processing protease [Inhella inkyongensis]